MTPTRRVLLAFAGVLLILPTVVATGDDADDAAAEPKPAPWTVLDPTREDGYDGQAARGPIRLHAQMHAGLAYLVPQDTLLPNPQTDTAGPSDLPLIGSGDANNGIQFLAYDSLQVQPGPDGGIQMRPAEARAAWDTVLRSDIPVTAHWRLSITPSEATEALGSPLRHDAYAPGAPALLVTTQLTAVDLDGVSRTVATGYTTTEVETRMGELAKPQVVAFPLKTLDDGLGTGDRLVVDLTWRWLTLPGGDELRPPVISVHPGSWFELGIDEPLRLSAFEERRVLDGLFVKGVLEHLFHAEHIDIDRLGLTLLAPQGATTVAERVIDHDRDGDAAYQIRIDWKVPWTTTHLDTGIYGLRLDARQDADVGARLVATRTFTIDNDEEAQAVASVPVVAAAVAALSGMSGLGAIMLVSSRDGRRRA